MSRIPDLLAHFLSIVLHPGLLAVVVFSLYPAWVPADEITWVIGIMVASLLVPAVLMGYEVKKAGDKDFTLRSRRKRLMPLAIQSMMLIGACAASFGILHLRFEAHRFILLLTGLVVILWLITYRWKISLHTAGATFLALHVWLVPPFPYGIPFIILLAVVPMLAAWARWQLKVHSREQLLAGFGLGMAASLGVLLVS